MQTLDQIELNDDQQKAFDEILAAYKPGTHYLLTGAAGTGKTTLVQKLVAHWLANDVSLACTAPTHKAVSVIERKLLASGVSAPCLTLHSLLSLRLKMKEDKETFVRHPLAPPVLANIVIIDECSMVPADLMRHINRHLLHSFVLFVGDPAQIPPVHERRSQSFNTPNASHLTTVVRQAADNPVISAATMIRNMQETGLVHWNWAAPMRHGAMGIYQPGNNLDHWMKRGYCSPEFAADPDHCRFLCWTNQRVREINERVRRWLYADTSKPFSPGERALFRAPLLRDGDIIVATNEEPLVTAIDEDVFRFEFPETYNMDRWEVEILAWRMEITKADGMHAVVHVSRDPDEVKYVEACAADEARACPERWDHRQQFRRAMADVQSIYAMTVHVSQGSTFRNAFVDVRNIYRRAQHNLLEMQQLLYTAATRPSHALVLHGVPGAV